MNYTRSSLFHQLTCVAGMGRDGGKQEFALQFHAETDGLRHIARTPGIYVQAKKTRSVKNQRRQKAERGANRRRGGRATSLPIAAAVGRPSNDVQQELRRLRARVVRLEQENGRLRGRVRELEGGDQPAPLKRVKTEGLVVSTTMLAPPLVPKAPPRPQLIPIPSELKFGAFDEDFLQSMELLKSLTPRAAPLSNGCSTKRPRSDSTTSLADFLNAFGDFAPTPDLTDSS